MARGGRSLGYSIRVAMYSHLQRLSLGYHDKKRTGDVLTRVTGDVLVVEEFVVESVSNILGSLLVLVGSFALLFQSWHVALVALVVVPLLALVSQLLLPADQDGLQDPARPGGRAGLDRPGDAHLDPAGPELRPRQRRPRALLPPDREEHARLAVVREHPGPVQLRDRARWRRSPSAPSSGSACGWSSSNAITIGTLVLFILLLQNMFKPARKIVSEWYKIGKVFASVERIDDLLDREVVVQDAPDAVERSAPDGALNFDHVSFAYPAEHEDGPQRRQRPTVLHDIDFAVAPGEVVSLVGPSGAGKSTVAQLVPRLYDPDEGAVSSTASTPRRLTLSSLRSQVSLVLQDTVLLSGSVAENIGYGIADATPEQHRGGGPSWRTRTTSSWRCPTATTLSSASAARRLSGGQRQRIAIARAFIRETPILILDEPTTGLDPESTQLVLKALRSLMRGKTTIIISHDPGLIRCADRILVLSEGRIVESGGHQELISARGLYSELYVRELEPELVHTNGDGNGSHGDLWYGAEPEYAVVVPRRAQQAHGGE